MPDERDLTALELSYIKKDLENMGKEIDTLRQTINETREGFNSLKDSVSKLLLEKFEQLYRQLADINTKLSLAANDVTNLDKDLKTLKETTVSKDEFAPVKSIAYAIVGVVALAVLYAVLHTVLKFPAEAVVQ